MDTVEIAGKKFLKCEQEVCEWNICWLSEEDWAEESNKGIRICNLGAKAIIDGGAAPPEFCRQPRVVAEMALLEFEF